MAVSYTHLDVYKRQGLGLTTLGVMPCRRSSARSRFVLLDCCSPFILTPRLSVPSQTNMDSWLVLRSTVTVFLAALRVTAICIP